MFGGWQSKQRDRHDIPPGRGDRHDVRYTDQERSTSNVQLSTFNGVTERADGGRNMGTDTICGGPADAARLRHTRYGDRHDVGYTRYGDRHDARYTDRERLTSNVQLSTFNWVTERADGGRDMGTDTMLDRRVWLRHPDMGTDTMSDISIRNV
jgi:hypothetical protein